MSQVRQIVNALKQTLRAKQISYKQLGAQLDVSEASVKRWFSSHSFTLDRLEEICHILNLEISDLVELRNAEDGLISSLSLEQEQEILADRRLALMAFSLLNHRVFDEIVSTYDIDYHQGIRYLAKLERMGLLRSLPNNRVKMLVARDFRWRPGGPIEQFVYQRVMSEFFQSHFNQTGEHLFMVHGMLSKQSNVLFAERMRALLKEFDELHQQDAKLPIEDRHGGTLVLALRHWEVSDFTKLRREPLTKRFEDE